MSLPSNFWHNCRRTFTASGTIIDEVSKAPGTPVGNGLSALTPGALVGELFSTPTTLDHDSLLVPGTPVGKGSSGRNPGAFEAGLFALGHFGSR